MKCASLRLMWGPEVAGDGQLMDNISTGLFQHFPTYFLVICLFCVFGQYFLILYKVGSQQSAVGFVSKHTMGKSSPSAMLVFIHCPKKTGNLKHTHNEKTHELEFCKKRSSQVRHRNTFSGRRKESAWNPSIAITVSIHCKQGAILRCTLGGRRKDKAGVCQSLPILNFKFYFKEKCRKDWAAGVCQTCPFKILNLIEEKNVDKIEQVCISLPPSAVPETVSFQPRVKWVLTKWALTCFGTLFTHRQQSEPFQNMSFIMWQSERSIMPC